MSNGILYPKESYEIVAAIIEVHKQLGCGFLEMVYQDALEVEFNLRNIPFEREKKLAVQYKGNVLKSYYVADFICFGHIIVELKAVDEISNIHVAQVLNYLKVTGFKLGLLVNFNEVFVQPRRIVLSQSSR
ncbi:MAG: GxxExxY protein [Bacteroidales bacterium]|nr:GxxExxY protein [Bacteroidales bacterium]